MKNKGLNRCLASVVSGIMLFANLFAGVNMPAYAEGGLTAYINDGAELVRGKEYTKQAIAPLLDVKFRDVTLSEGFHIMEESAFNAIPEGGWDGVTEDNILGTVSGIDSAVTVPDSQDVESLGIRVIYLDETVNEDSSITVTVYASQELALPVVDPSLKVTVFGSERSMIKGLEYTMNDLKPGYMVHYNNTLLLPDQYYLLDKVAFNGISDKSQANVEAAESSITISTDVESLYENLMFVYFDGTDMVTKEMQVLLVENSVAEDVIFAYEENGIEWNYRLNVSGNIVALYTNSENIDRLISSSGVLNVPSHLNGMTVIGIGGGDSSKPFVPAGNTDWTSISFPKTLRFINEGAFYGSKAEADIVIPPTITNIGEKAFYASKMKSLRVDGMSGEIGRRAFSGIDFTDSVNIKGANSGLVVGDEAFYASSAKDVTLNKSSAEGWMEIGDATFADFKTDMVTIRGQKIKIGTRAFQALAQKGTNVDSDYGSVIRMQGDNIILHNDSFKSSDMDTLFITGSGITIGESAFEDSVALSGIYLNGNVSLQDQAFFGAMRTGGRNTDKDGIVVLNISGTLGNKIFQGCSRNKEICINNENASSVLTVGSYSFSGNSNVRKISIYGNVEIGSHAFQNATSLQYLYFDTNAEKNITIGDYAFENATSISELYLPASIKDIDVGAFGGCTALSKLETATNLTDESFINSNKIDTVIVDGDVTLETKWNECESMAITSRTYYVKGRNAAVGLEGSNSGNYKNGLGNNNIAVNVYFEVDRNAEDYDDPSGENAVGDNQYVYPVNMFYFIDENYSTIPNQALYAIISARMSELNLIPVNVDNPMPELDDPDTDGNKSTTSFPDLEQNGIVAYFDGGLGTRADLDKSRLRILRANNGVEIVDDSGASLSYNTAELDDNGKNEDGVIIYAVRSECYADDMTPAELLLFDRIIASEEDLETGKDTGEIAVTVVVYEPDDSEGAEEGTYFKWVDEIVVRVNRTDAYQRFLDEYNGKIESVIANIERLEQLIADAEVEKGVLETQVAEYQEMVNSILRMFAEHPGDGVETTGGESVSNNETIDWSRLDWDFDAMIEVTNSDLDYLEDELAELYQQKRTLEQIIRERKENEQPLTSEQIGNKKELLNAVVKGIELKEATKTVLMDKLGLLNNILKLQKEDNAKSHLLSLLKAEKERLERKVADAEAVIEGFRQAQKELSDDLKTFCDQNNWQNLGYTGQNADGDDVVFINGRSYVYLPGAYEIYYPKKEDGTESALSVKLYYTNGDWDQTGEARGFYFYVDAYGIHIIEDKQSKNETLISATMSDVIRMIENMMDDVTERLDRLEMRDDEVMNVINQIKELLAPYVPGQYVGGTDDQIRQIKEGVSKLIKQYNDTVSDNEAVKKQISAIREAIFAGSGLTPEELENMSLEEIMAQLADAMNNADDIIAMIRNALGMSDLEEGEEEALTQLLNGILDMKEGLQADEELIKNITRALKMADGASSEELIGMIMELYRQIEVLNQEVTSYESDNMKYQAWNKQLVSQNEALRATNEQLEKDLEEAKKNPSAPNPGATDADTDKLISQIAALTEANAQLKADNTTLTTQNRDYENKVNQLNADITTYKKNETTLKENIDTYSKNNKELTSTVNNLNTQVKTLQTQNENLQKSLNSRSGSGSSGGGTNNSSSSTQQTGGSRVIVDQATPTPSAVTVQPAEIRKPETIVQPTQAVRQPEPSPKIEIETPSLEKPADNPDESTTTVSVNIIEEEEEVVNKGIPAWLIILLVVLLIIGLAVLVYLLVFKKKPQNTSDDDDDDDDIELDMEDDDDSDTDSEV